jgi:hypothetical protein
MRCVARLAVLATVMLSVAYSVRAAGYISKTGLQVTPSG